MSRLPVPGSDDSTWGIVLNDYLNVSHNADGTIKPAAISGKADDAAVVHNTGNEVVAGIKTFSSSPIVPGPTNSTDAANKAYVDTAAIELQRHSKILTFGSSVPLFSVPLANLDMFGAILDIVVTVTDGTDVVITPASVALELVNQNGTIPDLAGYFGVNQGGYSSNGTFINLNSSTSFSNTTTSPVIVNITIPAIGGMVPSAGYPSATYTLKVLTNHTVTFL